MTALRRRESGTSPTSSSGSAAGCSLRAAGWALCAILLGGAFGASADSPAHPQGRRKPAARGGAPSPKVQGLGKSCKKRSDCKHQAQVCLKESDANGKETQIGFCALPCLKIDSGLTQVIPGAPQEVTPETPRDLRKPPPPRCPPRYQCRSAGAGVPIDLCVKE